MRQRGNGYAVGPGHRAAELASGVYPQRGITLVRGEDVWVWDDTGRAYLDCLAGHGVAILGHGHPALVAAIAEQAERLITCPGTFANDVRTRLMAALIRRAPPGIERVFLCNSGAEAVEAALKFARLRTGRPGIVAARGSFHGRTLGALSVTGRRVYREPFEPLLPGVTFVPYNDSAALEAAVDEGTAAVILEPIQGEGGVRPGDDAYLRRAEALCRERGALFILDEVQTGMGRTGRFLAGEHAGLRPDLVCLAKGLAGGVPMGAVLIGERVGRLPPLSHGSTFGGNPLACAAALATLETLEQEDLVARADRLGRWFQGALRQVVADYPALLREVRGRGLMVGVVLRRRVTPLLRALQEGVDGATPVLALPAGKTVLRFLPPLIVGQGELAQVVEALRRACARMTAD